MNIFDEEPNEQRRNQNQPTSPGTTGGTQTNRSANPATQTGTPGKQKTEQTKEPEKATPSRTTNK